MTQTTIWPQGNQHDAEYEAFRYRIQARLISETKGATLPLFATDVPDLWPTYIRNFSPEERQAHNCSTCRTFIERFGGLVTIDEAGNTRPVLWHEEDAPERYRPSIAAMAKLVRIADVTSPFLSSQKVWGTPETGTWTHFAVVPSARQLVSSIPLTAGQQMAAKMEDFRTLHRALGSYSVDALRKAVKLLQSDTLYRSEKVQGAAEWLLALRLARDEAKGHRKANVVWRAIATAPAGFCHPRTSMIGTLLDDIEAGKDFGDVSRAFAAKMAPLAYQRPKAMPTEGAIEAAEKLVEKMGIAPAFARRPASLSEIRTIWTPKPEAPVRSGGMFGHLRNQAAKRTMTTDTPLPITWVKFRDTVLPEAQRIELLAPYSGSYCGIVTAVDPSAPPILQWDREDNRNPFSWYFYAVGSLASRWGLKHGEWIEVEAVTKCPAHWDAEPENHAELAIFCLRGARDQDSRSSSLFPEIMRSDLHGVRKVIEAHSQRTPLQPNQEPHASGIAVGPNQKGPVTVRVPADGLCIAYTIDRWD